MTTKAELDLDRVQLVRNTLRAVLTKRDLEELNAVERALGRRPTQGVPDGEAVRSST